ncbi:MAG: NADH-quinone oxidoreductase subunit D [Armatimonadetes bacterium]|nr:NADH-quinone oxidoreductase subunit D [Armatimonadota bacterium]
MSDPTVGTTDELLVNMGPQHPSTHGVLRVALRLDGEKVLGADPDIGYLHSSMEKIAEALDYKQYVPYADRFDYLNAMGNELCYVRAVERLAGLTVTPRCEYLRVILAELNRLASHLLYFAAIGIDLGATTVFLYTFRERELILDLFEWISGQRLLYHFLRVGGMRNDLPDGWTDKVRQLLALLPERFEEYDDLLTRNRIFIGRTRGVGVISPEEALEYGMSGPCLRACGFPYDLRKLDGYSVYPELDFSVCVEEGGDCYARHLVRVAELRESVKLIGQALDQLPEGDVNVAVPRKLKPEAGEVYERVESPRGELGCYLVSDGSDKPWRMHWRAPSFYNLSALDTMCTGGWMADMVAVIASTDIVLGDVDR